MSLVWENEPWWVSYREQTLLIHPWSRVRRSAINPALLAYYARADKAEQDLWTQIKPGRYLTSELSSWLTPKQIKYWAEWQAKGVQPTEIDGPAAVVLFATTPDDIEVVYINGPASCMSSLAGCYGSTKHPVRVYGAGDLAIAYLPDDPKADSPEDNVIARAICWPERKVFGRVYPTIDTEGYAETLRTALHALGYRSAHEVDKGLDGARMLRIDEEDGVTMPYLDSPYQTFDDRGDYLILRRSGEYGGTETNGVACFEPEYEHTCERCEEDFNDGGGTVYLQCAHNGGQRSAYWCDSCIISDTFTCYGFNEVFSHDEVTWGTWEGESYTQAWLDDNTFISDFSGDRISNDDMVKMHNGDCWSDDEFDRHGLILDDENWPSDDAENKLDLRAAHNDADQMELVTL
jgi:hypothetical protein